MAELDVYGIRHHGPGSARALAEALAAHPPEVVCVEMPADFAPALGQLSKGDFRPPVALVAYDRKDVTRALYYPLARFSPEWVALAWALTHGVPVVPIDLPAKLMLGLAGKARRSDPVRVDPLGELARAAGYADRERWWEDTFELRNPGAEVFPAVTAMISALRAAYPHVSDEECRLREAHMARMLRKQVGQVDGRVAVVCGAWHAPVLAQAELRQTVKGYAERRRGLSGPRVSVTWIPWTYERLRSSGGYGAGVPSPRWYGMLFDDPSTAPDEYLARTAGELRKLGYSASAAQVVDAVELADALRRLRELPLAGLDELREAALGALAEGSADRLELVAQAVEGLGTAGHVPSGAASLPLQVDLEHRLRATRLHRAYREGEDTTRQLDLRKPAHLAASRLLYQLRLLDIPFGSPLPEARGAQGTFAEGWRLHWRPEFALRLLAAQPYGQRIAPAAVARLRQRLDAQDELDALTAAIDQLLRAGLFDELSDVTRRIRARALDTDDVWSVARSLGPVLRLAHYPSLRVTEASYLSGLAEVLLPKLCVGLAAACSRLDEEAAYAGFHTLRRLQPALGLANDSDQTALWLRANEEVAFAKRSHPLLAGFALRSLADASRIESAETARWLRANLAGGVELTGAGHFLEGFLSSSATVLLHQPAVFGVLDAWLQSITPEEFRALLPTLRRTTSAFAVHERRKLSALALEPHSEPPLVEKAVAQLPAVLDEALRSWLTHDTTGSTITSPARIQN